MYSKYESTNLTVDTQASWGNVTGTVSDNVLSFGSDVGSFSKPSSANIFSCSTGPFATSTSEMGAIGARLAAAFNRSTLLIDSNQPESEVVSTYYTNSITNHYARLLHQTYLDSKGYAFPYDDVAPTGGADQSGSLFDANPSTMTVTVGGPSSSSSTSSTAAAVHSVRQGTQRVAGRKPTQHQRTKRDSGWASDVANDQNNDNDHDDENHAAEEDDHHRTGESNNDNNSSNSRDDEDGAVAKDNSEVDLEKGLGRGKQNKHCYLQGFDIDDAPAASFLNESASRFSGWASSSSSKSSSPATSFGGDYDGGGGGEKLDDKKLTSSCPFLARSLKSLLPVASDDNLLPLLDKASSSKPPLVFNAAIRRLLTMFLNLSLRTLISRITMALFFVLFYFILPVFHNSNNNASGEGTSVRIAVMTDTAMRALLEGDDFNVTAAGLGIQSGRG